MARAIDLSAETPYALLALIGRLVSVAAAAGTLLAIYACGARTFGKRAGVFAAATFALVTPFVYYAKTANLDVPYLFWFALSLLFYLRAARRPARSAISSASRRARRWRSARRIRRTACTC